MDSAQTTYEELDVTTLKEGDVITVETRNSTYTIKVLSMEEGVRISGGEIDRQLGEPVRAFMNCIIRLGERMETYGGDIPGMSTSPVRNIRVTPAA